MAEPVSNPGHFLWSALQMITSADSNRVSKVLLRTLFDSVLGRLFTDPNEVTGPVGGFFGSDMKVIPHSGMTVRVSPGVGFLVKTPSTNYDPGFPMISLDAAQNVVVSAAHATLPRWDIVYVDAATDDVEPGSRNFYTGGAATVDTIREYSVTATYLAGTAASTPTVPTTPAGKVKIAEIYVAAAVTTINAADIRDMRVPLRLDPDLLLTDPPADYHEDFVPGSGDELLCSINTALSGIKVEVEDGEAVIRGYRHKIFGTTLTVASGDATHGRRDLIYADYEGNVAVRAGTPSVVPAPPALAADEVGLAVILVPATETLGSGCTITDVRNRAFLGTDQIRDDAVTTAKLDDGAVTVDKVDTSMRPIHAAISYTGTTSPQTVTIQMQDGNGDPITETVDFELLLLDQELNETPGSVRTTFSPSVGTVIQGYQSYVNPTRLRCRTNSSGTFTFALTNNDGAGTYSNVKVTTLPGIGDGVSQVSWREIILGP